MSVWRIRHALSPIVEAALVAAVAACGFFAIWEASLAPMIAPLTSRLATVPQAVPLDIDAWTRHDVPSQGFTVAIPSDWLIDASGPTRIRIGRSARELETAGVSGQGIIITKDVLPPRQEAANLAAEDFDGLRAATYNVMVDGRHAIFAVAFENARVKREAVYIPDGKDLVIVGAAQADPAVFATLVSTIKFNVP